MPLYSYECEHCGQGSTAMRKVDERDDAPKCDRCKPRRTMKQVIEGPITAIIKNPAVPRGGF